MAFRLDAGGFNDIEAAGGVFRNQLQSVTINSFNTYFRSAGNAGHSAPFFPCYAKGTMILTDRGEVRVEDLGIGDRVGTPDDGFHPVRWVGIRKLTFTGDDRLRPVRIPGAVLGSGRDLTVSPQHRVVLRSRVARRMFDADQVLIPAIALVASGKAQILDGVDGVTYVHFMCDAHQIVQANGVLSESLYLGQEARKALGTGAMAEILDVFPDLRDHDAPAAAAPLVARGKAQRLIARHLRNDVPLIEARA